MSEQIENHKLEEMRCATCTIRQNAEANPNSLIARIWRWHKGWCPGWKAYQETLAKAGKEVPQFTQEM